MRQTFYPSLTDAELTQMRQRLDQATPGPWLARPDGFIETGGPSPRVIGVTCGGLEGDGEPLPATANARFIAHARADLLRLLEEVDHLRQRVQEYGTRGEFADDDPLSCP